MKKKYFLIILSMHNTSQPSQDEKASPLDQTNTSQSLTPYSPLSARSNSSPLQLPIAKSTDSIVVKNEDPKNLDSLQDDLQAVQYRHQKLLNRLQTDKKKFLMAQESDRKNATFSRWEKIKKKPDTFKVEQQKSFESFLSEIKKQLEESQAYELECLQQIQNYSLTRSPKKSPKSPSKIQQEQDLKLDEMKLRHTKEVESLLEDNPREKLLKLFGDI